MLFKKNDADKETKKNIFTETDENGELPENSARRYFSVIGFSVLAAFIIKDLLLFGSVRILSLISPELINNPLISMLISHVTLYAIALPLCALMLRALPRATPLKNGMRAHHWIGGLCVSFALMIMGNYISNAFITFFASVKGDVPENPLTHFTNTTPFFAVMLSTVVIAPILEELFFRKLLCDKLLPLGEGYAIFISSAIFALAHGNIFQLFYSFLIGCLFAYIYLNTGKIRHSIIYHAIINLFGSVISPLIFSMLDLDALLAEELTPGVIIDNIIPLLAMLAYEFVVLGTALAGLVILFLNLKKIKLGEGLIAPQKSCRISCVFMNFGVASAILYFAAVLIGSLF